MKQIFKVFSLIILALAFVLVPFGVLTKDNHYVSATFDDTQTDLNYFHDTLMYLEYADDTLVGIDGNGFVYRSSDGTLDNLSNINVQLPINITSHAYPTNNSAFSYGLNKPLVYANNTLVYVGSTGSETQAYYSMDNGKNWSYSIISNKEIISNLNGDEIFYNEYPISVIYGNGKFALMTAYVLGETTNGNTITEYRHSNIYTSNDGKTWKKTSEEICVDYNFSYSGGYFFRTEYFSLGTNPKIYFSQDCVTWNEFESPIKQKSSETAYINPNISVFRVNNAFYLFGFGDLYTSTTLESWRKVATVDDLADSYKVVPYKNGAIFLSEYQIYYADLGETDVTNITCLHDESNNVGRYSALYTNTVTENDKYLIVGYNGFWGQTTYCSSDDDVDNAKHLLFTKQLTHKVNFVDYNGNIISSVEVADGALAVAPTNPIRNGYTFIGWDFDLTQPITSNTTITAQYEHAKCEITFLDGSQVIATLKKEYGSTLTADEIPTPTKDGYIFAGWNKETSGVITEDITFIAVFTQDVTLTIKYPIVTGTDGLLNQFIKTEYGSKIFTYKIGDPIKNSEYLAWYNDILTPWINDFATDGDFDYNTKYIGFETEVPDTITNNIEININYVDLYNVRLEHYSQLRFHVTDDYYYCFVGYLKTEKLVEYGYIFNANDFKRSDIDYEIYNASRGEFYNNLNLFEWLGWDYDVTKPITEDLVIKGKYKMPTINVRMFDAENYMFNEENQELGFMTIEDYYLTLNSKSAWDKFREGLRLFLLGRWGELGGNIADQIDLEDYISTTRQYHNQATQILTAFAKIDTDNPDIYSGIFKNGSVNVTSEALSYYSGTANENNMTYWVNPIVFSTNLYSLTCTVTYGTTLDSAIKAVSNVVDFIGDLFLDIWNWILDWWWLVALVVLAIIFRKELKLFLTLIFAGIGKFFKWIGSKIKASTKKRNQAKKEYKKTKQQSNKKE